MSNPTERMDLERSDLARSEAQVEVLKDTCDQIPELDRSNGSLVIASEPRRLFPIANIPKLPAHLTSASNRTWTRTPDRS